MSWFSRNIAQRATLFSGLVRYRMTGRPSPLIANLFITSRCNARCVYCYVEDVDPPDARERRGRRTLTGEEWKELIDSLIGRGTRMFTLVGGEPLVSPHVAEIIEHLHRRDVFFILTTNGSLVRKRLDLVRKVSQLTISLDGDPAANDAVRGQGWHEHAMDAIEAAREGGIPVRLNVVVTRANADQIPYIVGLCDRHGMYVTFTPCIDPPEFRRTATRSWQLDDAGMREFFRELRRWKGRSPRIMNSLRSIDYMIAYPTSFQGMVMRDDPLAAYYPENCPYSRIQYHFNEFGDVFPCALWWNSAEFSPGNLFENGLEAALAKATDMPCQYCSFCNMVDWNELTRPKAMAVGLSMTIRQALGGRKG